MLRKSLVILALFLVSHAHAFAAESSTLKLYPLKTSSGACNYQLKGTKNPKTIHFAQGAGCFYRDRESLLRDVKNCASRSYININKNEMALRQNLIEDWIYWVDDHDNYIVDLGELKERDCEKVSCEPFYMEAVLTVKRGSLQRTFEMRGGCEHPN